MCFFLLKTLRFEISLVISTIYDDKIVPLWNEIREKTEKNNRATYLEN